MCTISYVCTSSENGSSQSHCRNKSKCCNDFLHKNPPRSFIHLPLFGGEHLERTHHIDTVILDKTGTVTKGIPELTDVILHETFDETELLSHVASAENQSEHPLAQAIVQWVKDRNNYLKEVQEFEAIPGYGVKAIVDNKRILIGTRRLMDRENIDITKAITKMETLESNGKTAMLVSIDGTYLGIIALADARNIKRSRSPTKRIKY